VTVHNSATPYDSASEAEAQKSIDFSFNVALARAPPVVADEIFIWQNDSLNDLDRSDFDDTDT
jgi:hypothetical protein